MGVWHRIREHLVLVVLLSVGLVAALLTLTPLACEPQPPRGVPPELVSRERLVLSEPPTVRVLLGSRLKGLRVPTVSSSGPVTFEKPGGGPVLARTPVLKRSTIVADGAKLRVGRFTFSEPVVFIRTNDGTGTIRAGDKHYRGDLEIRRHADGSVTLVNHLDLESYTRGVVAGEMPNWWPGDALRAQAIVSRTYAYALVLENSGSGLFDVTGSFRTAQVYNGISGETRTTDRAVSETRGLVLTYDGKPFRAYFCSTCGGHTEACGLVWGDYPTIAPLSGVDCPYDVESKWFRPWRVSFSEAEIRRALGKAGHKVSVIKDIRLIDRNKDGHHDRVNIVGERGTLRMRGNDFRLALGSGKLKSLMCRVSRSGGGVFVFSGRGFGHGVGMCQFGALGMAKQGMLAEEVIHHYYPGCEIWKIYN